MRIFALAVVALLVFAGGSQLYLLQQHQTASLAAMLLSKPLSQQVAWAVMLAAPVLLLFAALWGHERMVKQRRTAAALAAQLKGMKAEVQELHTAQKDNEDAAKYLIRSEAGYGIAELRGRMTAAEQMIEDLHSRNEAAELLASIENIREQQKAMRERLGDVIAKRASIETMLLELQTFQDQAEQAMARMEEDKNGDTLDVRLRKLVDFGRDANFRSDEIERSLRAIVQQQQEFDRIQSRLAPLVDEESGVRGRLRVLQDVRGDVAGKLESIERDGGVSLPERVQQLADSRASLEQRLSDATLRCEEIERALQAQIQQQKECDALKSRLAPLLDGENGVRPRLRTLQDSHADLVSSLEGVERDGGVPLPERVQHLADSRSALEQRVAAVLDQVEKIETVQKEISALFAKLNQAHRVARDGDSSIRIVSHAG
jgi:chromosome segregation ATPase